MRRRDFITLLGGASAAWPVAARAQQRERMRRVGVFMNLPADDSRAQARVGSFQQGLQQLGWVIDRNVSIDYRWGLGDADQNRRFASDLVAVNPDVILAVGGSIDSLRQSTRTIPIVFVNRSRWPRHCCKFGPSRRQCHRLCECRIQPKREAAGITKADRARREAGRSHP
jgi:putative ABC transport system substrate-binding protein